jgi:hypothetical protein
MRTEFLKPSSTWIADKRFDRFVGNSYPPTGSTGIAEFGAFEANLAEAIVLDRGADFLFSKWGAEIGGEERCSLISPRATLSKNSRQKLRHRGFDSPEVLRGLNPPISEDHNRRLGTGDRFRLPETRTKMGRGIAASC